VLAGAIALLAGLAIFWFGVRPFLARRPVETSVTKPIVADTQPSSDVVQQDRPDASGLLVEPVKPEPAVTPPAETVDAELVAAELETSDSATASANVVSGADLSTAALSIPDYGVGTSVRERALVGTASEFPAGTRVVFWTRVIGGEPGTRIRHVWMHEGDVVGSIELTIGGAHWRTYSNQTLRRAGSWVVEARDAEGRVLARRAFLASDGAG
jgi:hypothetical protein